MEPASLTANIEAAFIVMGYLGLDQACFDLANDWLYFMRRRLHKVFQTALAD